MNRTLKIKNDICNQIMRLDLNQLETLTDTIERGELDGMTNPPEVLTCSKCEILYGDCKGHDEECLERYRSYMLM